MRSSLHKLRAAAELLATSPENIANDPAELAKLLREADTAHTRFGETVSLSGDGNTALIKAVSNDFIEDKKKGGSYIFVRDRNGSYSQQAKFVSLEGFSGYTNQTVSLSSDGCTIIGSDSESDAVYIFTKGEDGSWSQQVKIAEVYGGYPVSLSADGREALVTYRLGVDVHILVKHEDGTWSQEAELHPEFHPNHSGNVLFGLSVSLSANGQTALVGAPHFPYPGVLNFSSVYVFVKGEDGSWSQQARLTAEEKGEYFGWDVSLSADGRTALIKDNNNNTPSVYVFVKGEDGSWSQQAKLTAEDGETGDGFGNALSLSADGRIALIGAGGDDDRANNSGAAYVFVKNDDGTWHQRFKLTAEDGEDGDNFGDSVSLSADGQTALIGAPRDDDRGENSGSAYLFSIPPLGSSAPVAAVRLRQ